MEKIFKIADIRKLEQDQASGKISYSKFVDILNEMAHSYYSSTISCNNCRYSSGLITCNEPNKDCNSYSRWVPK